MSVENSKKVREWIETWIVNESWRVKESWTVNESWTVKEL